MDREKVIKEFADYVHYFKAYCIGDIEDHAMMKDVLKLLKEQEAVEPEKENDGNPEPWTAWWYVCGDCGQPIDRMDRYCRRCGKQVKWNE